MRPYISNNCRILFLFAMLIRTALVMFGDEFDPMTEKLNLVEIVCQHVLLQQSRKALKGKRPFYIDETTSLLVIPHSNIFKCFGCGVEGGRIEFLMDIKGKSREDIVAEPADHNFPDQQRRSA
jgi:DNA primase